MAAPLAGPVAAVAPGPAKASHSRRQAGAPTRRHEADPTTAGTRYSANWVVGTGPFQNEPTSRLINGKGQMPLMR